MINDRPPVATITNQHIYSLSKKKTIYTAITSTTTSNTIFVGCLSPTSLHGIRVFGNKECGNTNERECMFVFLYVLY